MWLIHAAFLSINKHWFVSLSVTLRVRAHYREIIRSCVAVCRCAISNSVLLVDMIVVRKMPHGVLGALQPSGILCYLFFQRELLTCLQCVGGVGSSGHPRADFAKLALVHQKVVTPFDVFQFPEMMFESCKLLACVVGIVAVQGFILRFKNQITNLHWRVRLRAP